MKRSKHLLLSAAAIALSAATASANTEYAVFDLGALVATANGNSSSVGAVNLTGQVAMTNSPDALANRAFRYSAGTSLNLETLGGSDSYGYGINNAGQVVGRSKTAAGVNHAYLWTPGGTGGVASNPQMKDLNPTGGASDATAINSSGQVVGYVTVTHMGQPDQDRPYLYSNGSLSQLPLPAGGYFYAYAYGVNDAGKVVGEAYTALSPFAHGFLYNGATTTEIGNLGGASSTALAINNNDRIVGYSTTPDGYDHAFLVTSSGMADLGTLGGHYSYAKAINNKDQIVGGSFTDDLDTVYHAFLSDGTTMTDLNSKVTSKAANWVLAEASGMNDNGVIVGTGTLSGERHGFMLRPLLAGDANADGSVDFNDLVALAQNYNTSGSLDWEHGDFTGDGNVDFNDLVALAQNYNTTQGTFASQFQSDVQAAFAQVPEPGACCALALASLLPLTRRPRTISKRF
jgi:probable HAF family extracellular repeat protein